MERAVIVVDVPIKEEALELTAGAARELAIEETRLDPLAYFQPEPKELTFEQREQEILDALEQPDWIEALEEIGFDNHEYFSEEVTKAIDHAMARGIEVRQHLKSLTPAEILMIKLSNCAAVYDIIPEGLTPAKQAEAVAEWTYLHPYLVYHIESLGL